MEKYTHLKLFILAIIAGLLSSCGGGNDRTPDSTSLDSTPLDNTPEAPDFMKEYPTTMRVTAKGYFDFVRNLNLTIPDKMSVHTEYSSVYVLSISKLDEDTTKQLGCDSEGPFTFKSSETEEEPEDTGGLLNSCEPPHQHETKYTMISDDNYKIEMLCDGIVEHEFSFMKLSGSYGFNFGRLLFTSNTQPDLDTTEGVCGTRSKIDSAVDYSPDDIKFPDKIINTSSISVSSPYGDEYIQISFTFFGVVSTGTYSIVAEKDVLSSTAVTVSVETTSLNIDDIANNGTVTVSNVSDSSATASFDMSTSSGTTYVGSFIFDLK